MKKLFTSMCALFLLFTLTLHTVTKAYSEELSAQQTIQNLDTNDFLALLNENKGKLILVNFFASWCPPCVKEVPDFVEIVKQYPEKEILIIGLSLDEDKKALQNFLKKNDVNYPIYYASRKLAAAYKVSSIPLNIVYDKKLKPIYNKIGILTYEQLEEMLKSS